MLTVDNGRDLQPSMSKTDVTCETIILRATNVNTETYKYAHLQSAYIKRNTALKSLVKLMYIDQIIAQQM